MPGLLADVNLQGHLAYIERRLAELDLLEILSRDLGLNLVSFAHLNLDPRLDDRSLWLFCQNERWVLLTDNRNRENENSLQATMDRLWQPGLLPVITLANKDTFENNANYAARVAEEIAEVLFLAFHENIRGRSRIYVPQNWHSDKG